MHSVARIVLASSLVVPAAAQEAQRPAEARSLSVAVTDAKGVPIQGLAVEDVAVLENGVAREVTRIEPDTRPLTALVLVDNSQPVSSVLRLHVVDAVAALVARLPEGARFALWTTGDRPTKAIDYTDDRTLVKRTLQLRSPQGGNTLLDAIVEATADLRKREGARTAVIVVTGEGPEFSSLNRFQVVEQASPRVGTFWALQYLEATEAPTLEMKLDYDYVLGELARLSGGLYETSLSAMGVDRGLDRISADLLAQYRLTYATVPDLKERRVTLSVARPGAKARVGAILAGDR